MGPRKWRRREEIWSGEANGRRRGREGTFIRVCPAPTKFEKATRTPAHREISVSVTTPQYQISDC